MRPLLSVMHAKAHSWTCEVSIYFWFEDHDTYPITLCMKMLYISELQLQWGGRTQEGAGNTIGEEVEQVKLLLWFLLIHSIIL